MGIMPRSTTATVVVLAAILGLGSPRATAEVPTWIASEPANPSARPLWVSVEVALTTDGSLRSELFSSEFAAAIDRLDGQAEQRRRSAESEGYEIAADCAVVVPYDCEQSGPSRGDEPDELYANSRFILVGRVTHSRQGFFRQTAGQLLEVVVEERLKAPVGAGPHRSLLLFLRAPAVSLPLRRFCVDGSGRPPPALEARVLLLLDVDPSAMPGGVVVPLDNDLFLERSEGRLSAPRDFAAEGLSFDALLRGLRDAR